MTRLGELERAVMDVLWQADEPLAATDVQAALADRELAVTTVLTVLDRLGRKHLVHRARAGRAYRYTPATSRASVIAQTMLDALGSTDDRGAALARFIESVDADDADLLRAALDRTAPGAAGSASAPGSAGARDERDTDLPAAKAPRSTTPRSTTPRGGRARRT
jgi:predicted transcriptional regulator